MGAFQSTQNSEIFKTGTNSAGNFREKFQKIHKLLNFRKANYEIENSGNSLIKGKKNGNFQEKRMFENFCTSHEVASFSKIMQICNFLFSGLDIPCKDDGDAYLKMKIL